MTRSLDKLPGDALESGAANAALIDPSSIDYSREFRALCEQNKCGQYSKNWMCPPAVGSYDELHARISKYRAGLLFQTVHSIADSLDWKGMKRAFKVHDDVMRKIIARVSGEFGADHILALGAGPCTSCEVCAAVEGKPCRFPEKAVASCESYGMDVAALVGKYGIPYHHGKNTVSFVGCILFEVAEIP